MGKDDIMQVMILGGILFVLTLLMILNGIYGVGKNMERWYEVKVDVDGAASFGGKTGGLFFRPFLIAGEFYYCMGKRILETKGRGSFLSREREIFKGLLVKENVDNRIEAFHVKNLAILLAGSLFCSGALLAVGLWDTGKSLMEIETIKRPVYGGNGMTYSFTVMDDLGNERQVQVTLGNRKYSEEEIGLLFQQCFEELKLSVLGENASFDAVESDLDFSGLEKWSFIDVSFISSDYSLLAGDGSVDCTLADSEGSRVLLSVILQYEEYSEIFEITITILHRDNDSLEGLASYLMQDSEAKREQEFYSLPKNYNGLKLRYYEGDDAGSVCCLIFLIFLSVCLIIALRRNRMKEAFRERNDQMIADYPDLVSKLIVLMRAGMPVRAVFQRIAADYEGERRRGGEFHYVYEEIKLSVAEMDAGEGEEMVYLKFGKRCGLTAYLKLGNMLYQNLRKGSQGIAALLEEDRIIALENAGRNIRVKGQLVGTRLLLPMVILFALVMAIILVPSIMSFQM